MNKTIQLNIPEDTATRIRQSMLQSILTSLVTHEISMSEAIRSIEDLISVERAQYTGRTRAGNNIGGI